MISRIQKLANQQNALKSTGPGNSTVTKYNSLKHGLTAEAVLIRGESEEAYKELAEGVREQLMPQGAIETEIVDQIILCFWRLRRVPLAEQAVGDHITKFDNDPKWVEIFQNDSFGEITRHESRITRQLFNMLGAFYKMRGQDLNPEQPS